MRKFNWDEFKEGKFAVHCKTEEEAKDFCRQMYKHGMVWGSGNSYLSCTHYEEYKDKTCCGGQGGYQSYDYFEKYRYEILEWSDYMDKEFTKADLRDGMVVRRDGRNHIGGYDDDLKWEGYTGGDIVKVYRITPESLRRIEDVFIKSNLELIWERTESKKMTVEEMRKKLEELTGEEIEVV